MSASPQVTWRMARRPEARRSAADGVVERRADGSDVGPTADQVARSVTSHLQKGARADAGAVDIGIDLGVSRSCLERRVVRNSGSSSIGVGTRRR
jgi:hypothetical protein